MIQTKLTATASTICFTQEEYQNALQQQVQLAHRKFHQTFQKAVSKDHKNELVLSYQ